MLCRIELDATALRHNYRLFCASAGRHRVAPVLKSNAYGHGLETVYRALAPETPAWLCVNYIEEALSLRRLGFQGRLLVLGPAVARELDAAAAARLDLVIGNQAVLDAWLAAPRRAAAHLKFDTGMSRQGFMPSEAKAVAAAVAPHAGDLGGVCTHFANVEDVTDHSYAEKQLERFRAVRTAFAEAGLTPMAHAASSASALIMADSVFDLVRIGISLYGEWPSALTRVSYLQTHARVVDLKPVLSWRTEVTTVKTVPAGEYVGYGCTYRTNHPMRLAVLPVGYFEGYPRLASESQAFVLIRGQRCPMVGRICMNMLMVDTTHLQEVKVGDVATLIGNDGEDVVSAHDVAGWAKTIQYEVLSRLHPDIPRLMRP